MKHICVYLIGQIISYYGSKYALENKKVNRHNSQIGQHRALSACIVLTLKSYFELFLGGK
jgi:hypothetical protein